jgi:hypothetical protein
VVSEPSWADERWLESRVSREQRVVSKLRRIPAWPLTMRRAQSVRNYGRPSSIALSSDDLGVLRENDESNEDILRRQLLDKDRENDKLQTQIETLQAQLAQRPPLEQIQELEKEYKHLELLLQGTQRENERCMAELERYVCCRFSGLVKVFLIM